MGPNLPHVGVAVYHYSDGTKKFRLSTKAGVQHPFGFTEKAVENALPTFEFIGFEPVSRHLSWRFNFPVIVGQDLLGNDIIAPRRGVHATNSRHDPQIGKEIRYNVEFTRLPFVTTDDRKLLEVRVPCKRIDDRYYCIMPESSLRPDMLKELLT